MRIFPHVICLPFLTLALSACSGSSSGDPDPAPLDTATPTLADGTTVDDSPIVIEDEIAGQLADVSEGDSTGDTLDAVTDDMDDALSDGSTDGSEVGEASGSTDGSDDGLTDDTVSDSDDTSEDVFEDGADDSAEEGADGGSNETSDDGSEDSAEGSAEEGSDDSVADGTTGETLDDAPAETTDGSADDESDGTAGESLEDPEAILLPDADSAVYSVTLQSLWFVEDYPQDFPDGPGNAAHLSWIGGATHNAAVSFWEPGATASPGIEQIAETGVTSIFRENDVFSAIADGTADSSIEVLEYTFSAPYTIGLGLPTSRTFDVTVDRDWPRVTLLTMLGPSPDWFVGVDGEPLYENGAWRDSVKLDLPIYDAGTKEGMSPFMGGTDIVPKEAIGLIAYDPTNGTYGPSDTPQTLARVTFERTR